MSVIVGNVTAREPYRRGRGGPGDDYYLSRDVSNCNSMFWKEYDRRMRELEKEKPSHKPPWSGFYGWLLHTTLIISLEGAIGGSSAYSG